MIAFEVALRKGLGRAMILLRESPKNKDFGAALLHASLVNQVYDRQCEEDRESYLHRLIVETGEVEFYRNELFRHLSLPEDTAIDFDKVQIFGILCCIAAGGWERDRIALRAFLTCVDYEDVGRGSLFRFVWLEGVEGFLFCIQTFHRFLSRNFSEDGWVFRSLLYALEDRVGAAIAASTLQHARSEFPELDALMRLNDAQDYSAAVEPEIVLDYIAVKSGLDSGHSFPHAWIKAAPVAELELAARDLLIEEDEEKVRRYLNIYGGRDFPLRPAELFRFVHSRNKRISNAALRALRRISHPDIRELALRTISEGTEPELAIRLLASNFQPGDLNAVEVMVNRLHLAEDTWHGVGMAVLQLFEWAVVSPEESQGLLVRLYEETPCSLCRSGFVRKLFAFGDVPDWMANEARFDADPRTAGLFNTDAGAAGLNN